MLLYQSEMCANRQMFATLMPSTDHLSAAIIRPLLEHSCNFTKKQMEEQIGSQKRLCVTGGVRVKIKV